MEVREIRLTADDMKGAEAAFARGTVPVILSLSAFDVPQSFTVDPQGVNIRVTFNYIDQEPSEERFVDEGLTVSIGKNSGKVLGFTVKQNAQLAREITVRIAQGVDQQIRHS